MAQAETFNPYQAPKSIDFVAADVGGIVYDGKTLMIPKQFTFPAVCLKTGAVTDLTPPQRRKLSWYPPLVGLLIIVNILIFAIVAACVSKKGEIHFQLTNAVARKRRNTLLRNWAIFGISVGLICGGAATRNGLLIFGGIFGLLVAFILACVASRFLAAKRIDKTHIWLTGVPDDVARALATGYGRMA